MAYIVGEVVPNTVIPKKPDTGKILNIRAIPSLVRLMVIPSSFMMLTSLIIFIFKCKNTVFKATFLTESLKWGKC